MDITFTAVFQFFLPLTTAHSFRKENNLMTNSIKKITLVVCFNCYQTKRKEQIQLKTEWKIKQNSNSTLF